MVTGACNLSFRWLRQEDYKFGGNTGIKNELKTNLDSIGKKTNTNQRGEKKMG